ncbi:MAG: FIST signal transduction protein [Halococcoides sp.]
MSTTIGTGRASAETGDVAAEAAVDAARADLDGARPDFAVVFASSVYDPQTVVRAVRAATDDVTLVGASTSGEFTEAGSGSESIAVFLVSSDTMQFHAGIGTGLRADLEGAVESAAGDLPAPDDAYSYRVGLNLHDGLLGRGEEIALLGYNAVPMPYAGGSAADDMALDETVVFANDRVEHNAVVLAMIESERPFAQSVGHGHEPISGGHEATRASESVVAELDGRPAIDVWTDAIADRAAHDYDIDVEALTSDHDLWSTLLTRFEFGIRTDDDTYKIRWPGLTDSDEGPMTFATAIPEGTELYVMDSDPSAQLGAAERVGDAAVADGEGKMSPAGALVFGCVCQSLILGEQLDDAVERMAERIDAPLAGMQTYGEVAITDDDMRAYHNTTSSVLLFPE